MRSGCAVPTQSPVTDGQVCLIRDEILLAPSRICFVCTGNTCRSPMAAAVFNSFDKLTDTTAVSCGLCARDGDPISRKAVAALKAKGIASSQFNDYEHHRARKVSESIMSQCDRIIGITESHALALISEFPKYASKITSMTRDIPDPFGRDQDCYLRTLDAIIDCLREMFAF